MRSTFLVILSSLVLIAAFMVYWSFQADTSAQSSVKHGPGPTPVMTDKRSEKMGPGKGAWVVTYRKDGYMENRFRADDYTPLDNGRIDVTNPVAEFYMGNPPKTGGQKHQQMMRLIGKTGEIVMPAQGTSSSNGTDNFLSGTPERGEIHDVTIQIFNMFPDSDASTPDETITTNNVQFENSTRRITTEAYRDGAGQMIARDQVAVHMTSDNDHRGYDFNGRGLTLRWNDADGRLDLLDVAHGERLVIKDTSSSSGAFGSINKEPKSVIAVPVTGVALPVVPTPVASAVPPEADAPPATTTQPVQSQSTAANPSPASVSPVPYWATFFDNVRITQGQEVLITADRMDLDFVSRQKQESEPGPTTRPAPVAAPAQPVPMETTTDRATIDATQPTTTIATTLPTTRPAPQPVVIEWTGRLLMLSAQPNRPKVNLGDAIVDLTGDPVEVRRTPTGQHEGDDVRAARLVYHTADGSVRLENSKTSKTSQQVVINKLLDKVLDPSSTVTTDTLDYATGTGGGKVAVLTGPGHALMPMATGAGEKPAEGKKPELMDTHWEKEARVYFAGKNQQDQTVDHVDLSGEVDVKHPQLAMHSQVLSLFFEPPTSNVDKGKSAGGKPQQELKRVAASQEVHCEMVGQNRKKQIIDCDDLQMQTARSQDGKFYARQVDARGSVHASDPDQELRAGTVFLTLKPAKAVAATTRPVELAQTRPARPDSDTASAELEKLIARENVTCTNKDKSIASGSELIVTTENDQNHIRLVGSPLATVIDAKQNMVAGPLILVEQGVAHVVGSGNMHVLQEQTDGSKPRPMDIAWMDRADMNGPQNRVDITGGVSVTTHDADGTVNVARGDRLHIDLAEKPAPATRPATASATHPARNGPADSMQMDLMRDKQASRITIDGKAQVISTLRGADGSVARQLALFGPTIFYQLQDSKELPARTLFVPHAGRMYIGDHRPSKAKPPEKGPEKADAAEDDASDRGDTAFQWSKQLTYSETQRQATILGDVLVVHQPAGKQAEEGRVRINSDAMTALFEPQQRNEKPAAGAPATRPAQQEPLSQSLQLKHLTADGNVVINRLSTGSMLYANRVDFEPLTHWMYAHGTAQNPARYIDGDPHRKPIAATEMQWNTQTWDAKAGDVKSANPK